MYYDNMFTRKKDIRLNISVLNWNCIKKR